MLVFLPVLHSVLQGAKRFGPRFIKENPNDFEDCKEMIEDLYGSLFDVFDDTFNLDDEDSTASLTGTKLRLKKLNLSILHRIRETAVNISSESSSPLRFRETRKKVLFELRAKEHESIPNDYHEPFIMNGYRNPGITAYECLVSLFCPTIDSGSVWSHFFPGVFFLWQYFKHMTDFMDEETGLIKEAAIPLLAAYVCVIILHFVSALAHTFNAISSRVRHMTYRMD